jgi:hypothetical protein
MKSLGQARRLLIGCYKLGCKINISLAKSRKINCCTGLKAVNIIGLIKFRFDEYFDNHSHDLE